MDTQTKTPTKRGRKRKTPNPAQLRQARQEVSFARAILRTWGAVAAHYGISKAAAHRIANDGLYRPSQGTIDRILAAPQPVPALIPTPPCPDCGSVHNGGRCYGRPVVVVLKPAQAQPKRKRAPVWRPCLDPALKARCKASGESLEYLALRGLEVVEGKYEWVD